VHAWRGLIIKQPAELLRLSRSVGGGGLSGFGIRNALPKTSTLSPLSREVCLQTSWTRAYLLRIAQSLSKSSCDSGRGKSENYTDAIMQPVSISLRKTKKWRGRPAHAKSRWQNLPEIPCHSARYNRTCTCLQFGGLRPLELTSNRWSSNCA